MTNPQTPSPISSNTIAHSNSQVDVRKILRAFTHDHEGIVCLGRDGILQSLDADRNVLSTAALKPWLVKAFMECTPWTKDVEDGYRGVGGRKTPGARRIIPEEACDRLLWKEARGRLKEREKRWAEEDANRVDLGCPTVFAPHLPVKINQGNSCLAHRTLDKRVLRILSTRVKLELS